MAAALPLLGPVEFQQRRNVLSRPRTPGLMQLLSAAGQAQEALLGEAPLMATPDRSRRCGLATARPHGPESRCCWQVVLQLASPGGVAHYS